MVFKQKNSNRWWYTFVWNGELIRESTKETNKRIAEQMEAAHKAALAKSEVGIRDKVQARRLADFAAKDFLPFIDARFVEKRNTLGFYRNGAKTFSDSQLWVKQSSTQSRANKITAYIACRRQKGLQVASKVSPKVELLLGERHRNRVLTSDEEREYFRAGQMIGEDIESAYGRALEGIRAMRGQEPIRPGRPIPPARSQRVADRLRTQARRSVPAALG